MSCSRLLLACAVLASFCLPAVASAQCIDYMDHLHFVTQLPTRGTADDLLAHGGLLYVAEGNWGITVLDPTLPPDQAVVGWQETDGHSADVARVGDLLFVADGWGGGLKILDLSTPPHPSLIGSLPLFAWTYGVDAAGSMAYVANYSGSDAYLHVVDAGDPTAPFIRGSVELTYSAYQVAAGDGVAYVACGWNLVAIDVSDPDHPVEIAAYWTPRGTDLVLDGDLLYVVDVDLLHVVDASVPNALVILSSVPLPAQPHDIFVADGRAYLGASTYGVMVVDVSDPTQPVFTGEVGSPGNARGLTLLDDRLWVACVNGGVCGYAGLSQGSAELIGGWPLADASGVAMDGATACVVSSDGVLQVLDLTDPVEPALLGATNLPGWPHRVTLAGDLAYVAAGSAGLQVVDLGDPTAPAVVGALAFGVDLRDVSLVDDHTLLVVGDFAVALIDVSMPTAPALLGTTGVSHLAYGCDVRGDLACVSIYGHGVATVDVSDPLAPAVLDSINTGSIALDVAMADGYAFVANAESPSLVVVDLANPANLAVVGTHGGLDGVDEVSVVDGIAYLAAGWSGLEVVDVSDPTAPEPLGGLMTPSRADDVAMAGELVLLADRDGGLVVAPAQCSGVTATPAAPPASAGLWAWPNPFNPTTTLTFALDRPGNVRLAIYDLRGRRIRTLVHGHLAAGRHEVAWDGRDASGRAVASGAYLARLSAAAGSATRRVCLVR